MSIKEYLSLHLRETEQKSDIVYVGIIATSLLLITLGGFSTANSYRESLVIQQQEEEMRTFVNNYNQSVKELNNEPYRAVASDELDDVQSNLIFSAQANHLELITLKNLSLQDNMEKEHGKSFEMNLLGSWADTVAFINGFSAKDALIAIRKVRFTPESDGKIKTTLEYKVFIK